MSESHPKRFRRYFSFAKHFLWVGLTRAKKHLKETKGFDHFCPSKVMPCRGERRKGFEGRNSDIVMK
ncbi:hypothetical protein ACFS7Y_21540 [Sphingobacterium bambusae]|uniref:Uncharacterized protein n=2 Tax=Sphingobacterium bambusae TaxID=662858 RepID=A0ABW6BMW6_9SPHI